MFKKNIYKFISFVPTFILFLDMVATLELGFKGWLVWED